MGASSTISCRSAAVNHDHAAGDHGDIEDRGVNMHRHALDEGPGEKRAGQRDRADQSAKASTCAVTTPARPNTKS